MLAPTAALEALAGVSETEPLGPGAAPCGTTTRDELLGVVRALRDQHGFGHLAFVTAVDGVADSGGLWVYYAFKRRSDTTTAMLRVWLDDASLYVPSLYGLWPAAGPLEREVYDLFGVVFEGHPDLRRILMWDEFTDYPMRKDYAPPADYEWESTPHDDTLQRAAQAQGVVPPTSLTELEKAKKK